MNDLELLDPDLVIEAYRRGYFPMADPRTSEISWYSPDPRTIIPLDSFRASRALRRVVRKEVFQVRMNTAFDKVIRGCARRDETWISEQIIRSYILLHRRGFAHCVESWKDGELVGGLYGVSIGGAFFGESMFSSVSDASKVALVHLVGLLKARGFSLLDSQFMNKHIEQFGATEIPRSHYLKFLAEALKASCRF